MSKLFDLLKEFDIAKLLPEMDTFVGQLAGWMRLVVLIAPLALLALGAWYHYAPPTEANYAVGYRTKRSMSSVAAWRYSQALAGRTFLLLGGAMAAVVFVISLFFRAIGPMGMAVIALILVIAEAVLIILLHKWLDKQICEKFDASGNRRK